MDQVESIRRYLEQRERGNERNTQKLDEFPNRLFEKLFIKELSVDHSDVEHGSILFSMKLPSRLLSSGNTLHGGATITLVDIVGAAAILARGGPINGVSVEISVSFLSAAYVDEDIEIEARPLRAGKAIAVTNVELRKKNTGKIVAQGRQTMYFPVDSKL